MQHDASTLTEVRTHRIQNALWGLFIGDALAMPAHWFYRLQNIKETFDGGITDFVDPPHPHPESFMAGMTYRPNIENAKKLGRRYDILHQHARFYQTNFSTFNITTDNRETEHGNAVPKLANRFHYHHGLKAGENTLGAQLVRTLIRSVIHAKRYAPHAFLSDFIAYMSTPGRNKDPYTEIYLRRWFENYTNGQPAHLCAEFQRNVWSIGSHGGIIRPMVISLIAKSAYQGLGIALEHQNLTHRSENVASALAILIPLLHGLIRSTNPQKTTNALARSIRLPKITGEKLFSAYREHHGPGNIAKDDMWRLHMEMADSAFELAHFVKDHNEDTVIRNIFANACYPEHGLPLLLYLAYKHHFDVKAALLANTNAGGDNVHRGMVLGLLVGAASETVNEDLKRGLTDYNELNKEIRIFSEIAMSNQAIY